MMRATASQDLLSGALNNVILAADKYRTRKVHEILFHFTLAVTEDINIKVDSVDGSTYDTVVDAEDLTSAEDYAFRPTKPLVLDRGDALVVTCTNDTTPASVVYVTCKYEV